MHEVGGTPWSSAACDARRITKYNGSERNLVADPVPSPGWSPDERIALEFTVYTLEGDLWLWDSSGGAFDRHRHVPEQRYDHTFVVVDDPARLESICLQHIYGRNGRGAEAHLST